MKDEDKSKRQLIAELASLRQQVAELKTLEAERKRAEEALRESERRYRLLIENIPTVAWVTSQDGRTIFISANVEKVYGYSPDEILVAGEELWFGRIHPQDKDRVQDAFELLFSKQSPFDVEYRIQREDGQWIWLQDRANIVEEKDGHLYAYGVFSDITERKQAEDALRLSQLRFRSLVEQTTDAVFCYEYDPPIPTEIPLKEQVARFYQGVLVECNDVCARSYGATRAEEVIGKELPELFGTTPGSLDDFFTAFIANGYRMVDAEGVEVLEDGTKRYFLNNGYSVVENGKLVRVWGTFRDITERKQAEEALRESERRLSSFMNSASDSFHLLDADLNFVEINQKGLDIIGKSREDVIGKNITDIVPDVKESGRYEKHLEVIRTGQPFEIEDFVPHPVFGDRHFILKSFKVGEGLGVIASDVTERKQAEEALQNYTERLQILHEIDQGILSAQSPEAIAQVAVTHTRQLIPCHRVGVALFDFTTNEAIALAVDADLETKVKKVARVQLDQFEHSEKDVNALQQGQIIIHKEFQPQEELSEAIYTEGARSLIAVPLMYRGELIGSFNLTLAESDEFSKEYEDITRQVADQLAIAIQQARLHEQIQRHAEELEQRVVDRTRELSVLYEVAAVASQPLDLSTTLKQTLAQVLKAMRSDAGAIHFLDEGNETRHLAVQQGLPLDSLPQLESLPAHQGPAGWVIEHGEPLIVPDITADPRMIVTSPQVVPRTYVGVPMRASGQVLGVLSVLRETTQPQFSEEELTLLTSLADQVGAVVESHRLRQVAEQAAIMEERQRLARDLHDSVTQSLYSLTLLAETGRRAAVAGNLESVTGYLERLGEVAQQSLKEMRLLVYELRPLVLEREGLVGALQRRLDTVEGRAGIETRLLVEKEVELAPLVEETLYRIALEALNNALKHAAAISVTVRIQANDDCVKLEIIDNGQGFDPQAISDMGGMGLVTMRERAERLGGTLTVLSRLGKGTTIKVNMEVSQ